MKKLSKIEILKRKLLENVCVFNVSRGFLFAILYAPGRTDPGSRTGTIEILRGDGRVGAAVAVAVRNVEKPV